MYKCGDYCGQCGDCLHCYGEFGCARNNGGAHSPPEPFPTITPKERWTNMEHPNIWKHERDGSVSFWFEDETAAFYGPYSAPEKAREEFERYCKEGLGP